MQEILIHTYSYNSARRYCNKKGYYPGVIIMIDKGLYRCKELVKIKVSKDIDYVSAMKKNNRKFMY